MHAFFETCIFWAFDKKRLVSDSAEAFAVSKSGANVK